LFVIPVSEPTDAGGFAGIHLTPFAFREDFPSGSEGGETDQRTNCDLRAPPEGIPWLAWRRL